MNVDINRKTGTEVHSVTSLTPPKTKMDLSLVLHITRKIVIHPVRSIFTAVIVSHVYEGKY